MQEEQSFEAKCLDCDWESDTRNSHPNAKRHAKKYNHNVEVNWKFKYTTQSD